MTDDEVTVSDLVRVDAVNGLRPTDLTLDELGVELRVACDEVAAALGMILNSAIRAGELLTLAKDKCGEGEWTDWLRSNFPGQPETARRWMRLWVFKDAIDPSITRVGDAVASLRGLPRQDFRIRNEKWFDRMVKVEAANGKSQRAIAADLGISRTEVRFVLDPAGWRETQRRTARAAYLGREAAKREIAANAAKKAGGAMSEAYSSIRRHALALDAAIEEAEDMDVKKLLREARNAAHRGEAKILEALGVS